MIARGRTSRQAAFATCLLLALGGSFPGTEEAWSQIVPAASATQLPAASGVRVEVGADPLVVRVGEPFRTAVRIVVPDGQRVEIGAFLLNDSLGAAGDPEIGRDDTGAATAVFPLVAWVAGAPLAAVLPVRVTADDGSSRVIEIALRLPEVTSVLPAPGDGAEVVPRPPRGMVPLAAPSSSAWPWLLLLMALAAIAALLAWWLRRRPVTAAVTTAAADPREWALAQLGPDGAGGLLASRDLPALATHVSRVLRGYVGRVRPALGEDLTTTEVVDGVGADRAAPEIGLELRGMLGLADRVKFARHRPSFEEAERLLAEARRWVSRYPPSDPGSHRGPDDAGPDGPVPRGPGPGGGGRRDGASASDAGDGNAGYATRRADGGASDSRRAA